MVKDRSSQAPPALLSHPDTAQRFMKHLYIHNLSSSPPPGLIWPDSALLIEVCKIHRKPVFGNALVFPIQEKNINKHGPQPAVGDAFKKENQERLKDD